MERDLLNSMVTEAIRRAEHLEETESPAGRGAWREVSVLEEKLARIKQLDLSAADSLRNILSNESLVESRRAGAGFAQSDSRL